MENRLTRPTIPLVLPVLLAIISILVLALTVQAASPREEVVIRGWLHAQDKDLADGLVVVEVDDVQCVRSILLRNGRFEFTLPVGAKARLVFLKPGFISKEVLVDTRNAMNTSRARKLNRLVKFDVVLDPLERHPGREHAGPVGRIHFVTGTGAMIVRHDVHLVQSRHQ
jgi:hypothetical protein